MGNANANKYGYYRKPRDHVMWGRAEATARRLQMPVSSMLTEAVREWLDRHQGDPTPRVEVKPNPRALDALDPFA